MKVRQRYQDKSIKPTVGPAKQHLAQPSAFRGEHFCMSQARCGRAHGSHWCFQKLLPRTPPLVPASRCRCLLWLRPLTRGSVRRHVSCSGVQLAEAPRLLPDIRLSGCPCLYPQRLLLLELELALLLDLH